MDGEAPRAILGTGADSCRAAFVLSGSRSLVYTARIEQAVVLALQLHRHQLRKGTDIPYATHLFAVASLVGENGGSEDEVCAALLHDAVEDQGGPATLVRIQHAFGDEVARIVWECSDTDVVPKPPWQARKEAYIAHLAEDADRSVLLVSCADKLHNARCILDDLREHGESVWERFSGGRDGSLWYYRSLLAIYEERLGGRMVKALRVVVDELHVPA